MSAARKFLPARRYGIHEGSWLPFRVRLRSPFVVTRLHIFDRDSESKWHSDNCWCRNA